MYHVTEVDKLILHPPAARGKRQAPISGVPSCQNHQNNLHDHKRDSGRRLLLSFSGSGCLFHFDRIFIEAIHSGQRNSDWYTILRRECHLHQWDQNDLCYSTVLSSFYVKAHVHMCSRITESQLQEAPLRTSFQSGDCDHDMQPSANGT